MKQIEPEVDLWWRNLSPENTKKLLVIINLLLAKIEINGLNRLISIKISKSEFEDNGIRDFDEVIIMVNRLSAGGTLFKVANNDFTIRLLFGNNKDALDKNENLKDNLVFRIIDLKAQAELIKIRNELTQNQTIHPASIEKAENMDELTYEISFTKSREILLNKTFRLAKPDFDSENEIVFGFLYEHPNKKYTKEEIELEVKRKITKSIHKIVENLGFRGDLKKVFIDATKTAICFRNPITKADLEKLGVTQIRLPR